MTSGIAVAVVPEEFYRKPKGVQFKKFFDNREDAIRYAEQHRCRIVIASQVEGRFDVLCDPSEIPGPPLKFELVVDRCEFVAVPRAKHSAPKLRVQAAEAKPGVSPPVSKKRRNLVYSWLMG